MQQFVYQHACKDIKKFEEYMQQLQLQYSQVRQQKQAMMQTARTHCHCPTDQGYSACASETRELVAWVTDLKHRFLFSPAGMLVLVFSLAGVQAAKC